MDFTIKPDSNGLPLGKLNYIAAGIAAVLSVLLIYATYRTMNGFKIANEATENYISWEHSATNIMEATDYLSEQTRNFVATGEKKYIENYFVELNVTRRREAAMAALKGASSYDMLEDAMKQSEALMSLERYAMHLVVSANNYDLDEFPTEIQEVTMLARDATLKAEGKQTRAMQILLNREYREKKETIDADLRSFIQEIENESRNQRAETMNRMHFLLETQRLLVFALIMLFALVIMMNSFLIINPLMKGILNIRTEQPLPLSGAYEYRYLAVTYNNMFEASQKKTSDLAYSASHDKLTGLYNRVGYDNLLKGEEMQTSALLLIDVDKFKHVNDTYGHDMGDRVLANIAHVLKDSFRSNDHICRIGGDEFATIMVDCGPQLKDLIRGKVERINNKLLNPTDDLPPISVSVGVAFGSEHEGSTGSIVKDADLALYEVKEHGRCGIEFFAPALAAAASAAALPDGETH